MPRKGMLRVAVSDIAVDRDEADWVEEWPRVWSQPFAIYNVKRRKRMSSLSGITEMLSPGRIHSQQLFRLPEQLLEVILANAICAQRRHASIGDTSIVL
jgi:hypothetical protein